MKYSDWLKSLFIKDSNIGIAGDSTHIKGDVNISTQNPTFTSATVLLFILVFVVIGIAVWVWSVPPRFAIENPVLRSDMPIIIRATNWQADKDGPVDIEFDGFLFSRKGIPVDVKEDQSFRAWQFILTDNKYTLDMLKKSSHQIRIGFPGDRLSCSDQESCKIEFINNPPIQKYLPDGRPAIVLNIVDNTLVWQSNVEKRLPYTAIFQDEKQIDIFFVNEYKIANQPVDITARYWVEQEDIKHITYISNIVTVIFQDKKQTGTPLSDEPKIEKKSADKVASTTSPSVVKEEDKSHTVTSSDTKNTAEISGSDMIPPVITNSIGARFVYIPPGEFLMGSPENEADRSNDERLHKVTLTRGFYMQTTEVTQGQWKVVTGENPSGFPECGDDCPVENVSWNGVQKFIEKLNRMDRERTGKYRLPTEAEWEYACRAGSVSAYSFGDNPDELEQYAWYNKNSGKKTHPVGRKAANAFGLYDMHGNVWEWCQDRHAGYPSDAVTDPVGPDNSIFRVSRGGSWSYSAQFCRSAHRSRHYPVSRSDYLGFRLVLFPGQQ